MLSAFFESLPGNPDWRAELAAAQDIDDISNVFRHVFSETMPPSNSPFFKDTFSSVTISIDQLVPREAADPERVKRAHEYMTAAKAGTGDKRAPVRVIDMGNGTFKVLDGNTTLQALKDLGETDVVVEIKKSLKQQGVKTIEDVYAAAEIALPAFKEWVEAFGAKTGAKVMLRPGLKGKDIAAEKVKDDYKGKVSKLLDVVGATLVFDTTAQVAAASSLISKDPAVFRIKNMFESPTKEGYLGIVMNVMIGGHICELQMNTASIIDAKEKGLGHDIHEVIRQLKPIAKQEDMGEISILADGFISRLNKISTKVYQAAAASRMSSSNSSANNIASDSETLNAFDVILNALSSSSISSHFAIDLPHMRNTLPPNRSMAYGTSSFSTNSKLRDSISNPPFDAENITRNGGKVNAKVITGKRDRAYLSDNDMLVLQYAVVEAKNLVASHNADFTPNPEFPTELQPRDRTRDTMKGQIPTISNTLNPDRLGDSLYASVGAPIVGRDLAVESGNGRTMAIRQRYNKDGATEYKAWIIQNAGKFGFNPEKLAEIQQPVLVRIRLSGGDRKSITERANEADIASMSPMEQAKVDDSRLTAADMENFTPSKDGDIAAASNAGFIAKFIEKVGKAEAAGLLTADSRPTKALVDRIQCAIFSKAYADDRLLTLMAEETHPAVKNILTALTAAAPVFAKIRASYPDMGGINLVDNIIEATRLMVQARDDGDGIEMILSQMGLFSQIPEETKTITRILNDNIRRSKHLGTVFKLAGERILSFLQNQNQVGLFGKQPPPTASEVITGAIARAAELDPANRQKGIFEDGDECEDDEDDDELVMEDAYLSLNLYADQQKLVNSIREAKTILLGKVSGDERASIERSLQKSETQLQDSLKGAIYDPEDPNRIIKMPNHWRLDIRNAKTFQDIADVFNREFGVTVDDDEEPIESALYESAKTGDFVTSPNGTINFGQITPEIATIIKRQAGFIRMRPGTVESFGEAHINRDKRLGQLKTAGYKNAVDLVYKIASGYTEIYKGNGRQLVLVNSKRQPVAAYIVLSPAEDGDYYDVKTAFPAKDRSFKNKILLWGGSQNEYHQRLCLAPSDNLGHSNCEEIINSPDKNVNKIFESVTDTRAPSVANKQPWEMTKDEYNEDYQDSPLQQNLIDKWANDSKTIKPKDRESFRASWWEKNNPHTQAIEQAMSEGLPVPDAVLKDYRNSPKIKWRIGIRKAKTFQDIADVFSDVFGVTMDDPA